MLKKVFGMALLSLSVALTGCGTNEQASTPKSESSQQGQEAPKAASNTPVTRVSLATGGTGGAWYPVGGGLANVVNEQDNNMEMSAEVTSGGLENVRLVNSNTNQFGFVNNDAAFHGFNGQGPFESEGKQKILGMFNLYPSTLQVVVLADSGIESMSDLKGKKVVVGPPASSSALMGWQVLAEYGIKEGDIKGLTISFAEGADALKDGNADALFVMSAHPNSQVLDLSATKNIRLLSIDDQVRAKLMDQFKYYGEATIGAETYKGQTTDVVTLSLPTMIIANEEVSEEAAYEFTKSIYDNLDKVHGFHAVAKHIALETANQIPIPMHPGAKKYFEEKGIVNLP
ncbi:TAXI family TRAP transporter solute-binding subunit [Ammoniphilus sp. YIM 78166]|uniref:TAXI family TRAP transporter solute-binding subunit n=1 Tax=Ammoniphilus sp. YIM 78166 TaxID=1644106 RepID=UPI00142F5317|nr:TAXI family TRAP transporter solute-binding subunit [Ammoniphilus sp. YIM 78166]